MLGFHAIPKLVPGGFVGVDVFFVVSGFLISSILFRELDNEAFSFAGFYARRVRRIFPALALVLAGVWAIGWAVLVTEEYRSLEQHIAAASAFVSNVLLWREAGYFDAPSATKPLLHLWSLGIEEQFYLIWPPLLYWCWRRRLNILPVLILIAAASFFVNVGWIDGHASAVFYLPTSRMWELLVGAALAWVSTYRPEEVEEAIRRVLFVESGPCDARWVANVKSGVGMVFIALAVAAFGTTEYRGLWFGVPVAHDLAVLAGLDNGVPFPGSWALLPVVGTMLVIWAGPGAAPNRRLLAWRPLVGLGLISYPLYLWHWPLLCFIHITESGQPSVVLRAAAVGLSLVLAWLTYTLVEQPLRRRLRVGPAAVALVVILTGTGALAWYGAATGALGPRTPQIATEVPAALRAPDRDPACRDRFPSLGEYCQVYARDLPITTALVGDSHAQVLLTGVGAHFAQRGENVVHLGQSGCPPLFDIETTNANERNTCVAADNSVLDVVGRSSDIRRVILVFRGAFEMTGAYRLTGTSLGPEVSMRRALIRTVAFLREAGKAVAIVIQPPEMDFDISECVARPFSFEPHGRARCAVPRATVDGQQAPFRDLLAEVSARWPEVLILDPIPAMCDDEWCYAVRDGRLLYADTHHLSRAGALFLAERFDFDAVP